MRELRADIEIGAPPDAVWQVLTDFEAYGDWNPFVVAIDGQLAPGARLTVRLQPQGGRAMTLRPHLTALEPGRVLEWFGRLWLPGLFDGRHRFALEPSPNGTRFVQSETVAGVLVPLLARSLDRSVQPAFEAMNEALRDRAETLASAGG